MTGATHSPATWLVPTRPAGWATRGYRSASLRYELALPAGWASEPEVTVLGTHSEELFADGLLVQYMEAADPSADIAGWAQATIALTGVPAVAVAIGPMPELLEWDEVPPPEEAAARLVLDELRLFEGLARSETLRRIYVVLGRRGREAWHLELALESAGPPGAPADLVAANDHVRAAAVLGALALG